MSGLYRAMSVGETAAARPVPRKTVGGTPAKGQLLFFVWAENKVSAIHVVVREVFKHNAIY